MTNRARVPVAALVALGVLCGAGGAVAAGWKAWGGDLSNTRSAGCADGFEADEIAGLTVKWTVTTGGDVSATPTVHAGSVYVPDFAGNLFRIDASSGQVIWTKKISDYTGIPGDISRTSPAIHGDTLVIGTQGSGRLLAVHRKTGALKWMSLIDDHPAAILTQSPVVHGNRVYVGVSSREEYFTLDPSYACCTFRGSMVAVDLHDGDIVWKTHVVPDNGGLPGGFSGAAVWGSSPVIDTRRGAVYFATGNNYEVPEEYEECMIEHADSAEDQQHLCIDVYDPPDNLVDAVVALDLDTGALHWAKKLQGYDAFNLACSPYISTDTTNCPETPGPDYDFGQAPMLFTAQTAEGPRPMLGVGQKSGIFWALDPDDEGNLIWSTVVGPGGVIGGMQWGSATDGHRIYTAISNYEHTPYVLPDGATAWGGSFAALDAATGAILWQTPDPLSYEPIVTETGLGPGFLAVDSAPVTIAGDVVLGGSLTGHMYAMDAATGEILWSFFAGGSVNGGAAVDKHVAYWGSGYAKAGTPNNKVYAFHVP